MVSRVVVVCLVLLAPAWSACPQTPARGQGALDVPIDPGGGSGGLTIVNPTPDTWDLKVDGAPRGSVGPRSEARITDLRVGPHTVVATNLTLGLEQRGDVQVALRQVARHTLRAMVARLQVTNPHDVAVEIVVDGVVIGRAAPKADTTFEAVPAGKRMLVARALSGPGAVRVEQRLTPEGVARWTVPLLAEAPADVTMPKPPDGMGLVHMKNESRNAVSVFVGGVDKGLVAPGAWADFVLPPGTHKIEVKIEGIEARTEHTVTLRANQAAEWRWGGEAP